MPAFKKLPKSLHLLCEKLSISKNTRRKLDAIGQSSVQVMYPRTSIAPFGLSWSNIYQSSFLTDTLNIMGFYFIFFHLIVKCKDFKRMNHETVFQICWMDKYIVLILLFCLQPIILTTTFSLFMAKRISME